MYQRSDNGVKVRADGKGDGWALAHRNLGPTFNMTDIDASFGIMAFGQNTGEKLFLEYVPDNYKNKGNVIRSFQVIALFDRKRSEDVAFYKDDNCVVGTAFYLWMARRFSERQSYYVRFFFVIGNDNPPWRMIELNISNGERIYPETVIKSCNSDQWKTIWESIGLTELRKIAYQALK